MKRKHSRSDCPQHGWAKKDWTAYEAWLDGVLDDVFDRALELGWSDAELASRAGLAYMTVYNIGWNVTRRPQASSVWKLVRAVGLSKITIAPAPRLKVRSA